MISSGHLAFSHLEKRIIHSTPQILSKISSNVIFKQKYTPWNSNIDTSDWFGKGYLLWNIVIFGIHVKFLAWVVHTFSLVKWKHPKLGVSYILQGASGPAPWSCYLWQFGSPEKMGSFDMLIRSRQEKTTFPKLFWGWKNAPKNSQNRPLKNDGRAPSCFFQNGLLGTDVLIFQSCTY